MGSSRDVWCEVLGNLEPVGGDEIMAWIQTLPEKGAAATAEALHNEFRQATIERASASNQWPMTTLPAVFQKGRRLTNELVAGMNEVIAKGWKWVETYTNWQTYSVWSLVTTPTDAVTEKKNIFELAIGDGNTDWRDSDESGGPCTARLFADMQAVANVMTTCALAASSTGYSTISKGDTQWTKRASCALVLANIENQSYFAAGGNSINVGFDGSKYYAYQNLVAIGPTYNRQTHSMTFTIQSARSGFSTMTGHSCIQLYPHARLYAKRTKKEGGVITTRTIGRDIGVFIQLSGVDWFTETIDAAEEVSVKTVVFRSDVGTWPSGTRSLAFFPIIAPPTDSLLGDGWVPTRNGDEASEAVVFTGTPDLMVLGMFAFDKAA